MSSESLALLLTSMQVPDRGGENTVSTLPFITKHQNDGRNKQTNEKNTLNVESKVDN